MKWERKGLCLTPSMLPWASTRVYRATPFLTRNNVLRIYIAGCDDHMIGRVGYVEVDQDNPSKILRISDAPVLDIGQPGMFDDNGVLPSCVVRNGEDVYLYYIGFQRGVRAPYTMFSGLAKSTDDGIHFERVRRVPVLDRTDDETQWRASSVVLQDGPVWRMWYCGGSRWIDVDGKLFPTLSIKTVTSPDGVHWSGQPHPCFTADDKDEFLVGSPWVEKTTKNYIMHYCSRSKTNQYSLGYAESDDGLSWVRKDHELGIEKPTSGFDSEMMHGPATFTTGTKTYLFYAGNGIGTSGFGYAELV